MKDAFGFEVFFAIDARLFVIILQRASREVKDHKTPFPIHPATPRQFKEPAFLVLFIGMGLKQS
jgi:hypothetical protein